MVVAGLMASSLVAQAPKKLLDMLRVTMDGDAGDAVVTPVRGPVREVACEIVIVGAGMGRGDLHGVARICARAEG